MEIVSADFKNLINYNFSFDLKKKYIFTIWNPSEKSTKYSEELKLIGIEINTDGKILNKTKKSKNNFGCMLLEFLNHYKKIYECIESYQDKIGNISDTIIFNSEDALEEFYCITGILDDLILNLKKIKGIKNLISILQHELSSFNTQFVIQISEYCEILKDKIKIAEKEKMVQNLSCDSISKMYLEAYKKQLQELNESKFYKHCYLKFIEQFKKYIENLYNICTNSFIPTEQTIYSNQPTKIYNGDCINLPQAKIHFKNNQKRISSLKAFRYEYEIKSLEEIIYINLYHIILNNSALLKCHNCGDYFLPKLRNNEKYCQKYIKSPDDMTVQYCRDIGKRKSYIASQSNTFKLYYELKDRINKKIERNSKNKKVLEKLNELSEELEAKCDEIFEKGKRKSRKNKRLKEFHNYLKELDKRYQKMFPSKRKYNTQKFYDFND